VTRFPEKWYFLRLILLFANTDVSTTKMCLLDTSILAKSIMGWREYRLTRAKSVVEQNKADNSEASRWTAYELTCTIVGNNLLQH
jgi:hypothetical protein